MALSHMDPGMDYREADTREYSGEIRAIFGHTVQRTHTHSM
jgi:hypothetical protein